ncbi:hypothetical protein GTQ45_02040 [Pyruvatibacter mobilis]|uniref:Uncharacterized protein n=1 Tax=Pyruvatibacter mobilis TaxID=1712261 RepID=A0A845Q7D5_9HYPH|nr:hypothetical protein [Pyruvatibacter mobilis]NBG94512.1 hypothetical protein [Pyruvatibacter mobilis]QJD74032.1 hypothetical protein HG718_00590 [Pyruvatibacter mobilis]GGD03533.1 hypothetical protein GCM10011587_04080 [Pyruvatibacter mobilis]
MDILNSLWDIFTHTIGLLVVLTLMGLPIKLFDLWIDYVDRKQRRENREDPHMLRTR